MWYFWCCSLGLSFYLRRKLSQAFRNISIFVNIAEVDESLSWHTTGYVWWQVKEIANHLATSRALLAQEMSHGHGTWTDCLIANRFFPFHSVCYRDVWHVSEEKQEYASFLEQATPTESDKHSKMHHQLNWTINYAVHFNHFINSFVCKQTIEQRYFFPSLSLLLPFCQL